jgi:hypothetical protein
MKTTWMLVVPGILMLNAIVFSQPVSPEDPFACNRSALTAAERKRHFDELGPALRAVVMNAREIPEGYEFQFPADPATFRLVAEWAAGEHRCCPFFDIDLRQERGKGPLRIRLTGRPGVKQFIETDFAGWIRRNT